MRYRENLWVMTVKLAGLFLIVAVISGACWTGWGDRPATRATEDLACALVALIFVGIAMILYEPRL